MLWYSLVMASDGVEVVCTPEEPQSVSRRVSCGKEPVSEPRKNRPKPAQRRGKNLESVGFHQNQNPPNQKRRCPNIQNMFTQVHQARIPVKPRAPMMNLARLRQAAILHAKNLASLFGPIKWARDLATSARFCCFCCFSGPVEVRKKKPGKRSTSTSSR